MLLNVSWEIHLGSSLTIDRGNAGRLEIIAGSGLRISLHAETASIMAWRQAKLEAAGLNDPIYHIAARPEVVAIEAVARAAVLSEWTGARIHVLHISSAGELRPLAEAKARGVEITGETCPCYLFLDSEIMSDWAASSELTLRCARPRTKLRFGVRFKVV